jgi:hypothetical protein
VSDLSYLLVVLTHGDGVTLEACLDSFREYVHPLPDRVVILRDGPGWSHVAAWASPFACVQIAPDQVGFCRATAAAWRYGSECDLPYVFHLEHDFVVHRPVDLRELALVLNSDPMLAQMALCRDAASDRERAAGGLVESRPGAFIERETCITDPSDASPQPGFWEAPWLEHRSYLTTNPSLMRREFMQRNPWPDYPSECEGRFGMDLVERGYRFGLWGDGSVYCRHIGVRSGIGY